MKPISKVPTKGVPLKMARILAEKQNELIDAVNYLIDAVKPKAKSKAKGAKK